jgi:hypothetical protein
MAIYAAKVLILVGASIFGLLGAVHLAYTFFTDKFLPRDRTVIEAMKGTSPVLTRQTTMWDAWIGFNASHSLGAILLAALYLLLAAMHMDILVSSKAFLLLGVAAGLAYLYLAHTYWFRIPFVGIAIATSCFAIAALLVIS